MKPISKRNRSVNWDEEEKQLLRTVLKDYSHIIEDKSLNTNTNKNKTKAWEEVHEKFNRLNCRQRDLIQLKIQWKGMKVNARKTYGSFRKESTKTGGGARPDTPDDCVIEVKDLLNPAELLRDDNPFDSDGLILAPTVFEVKGLATDVVSLDVTSQECVQELKPTTYEIKGPATDVVSFDIASQECEQIVEVDITATPQTNIGKFNARKIPKRNLDSLKSSKCTVYDVVQEDIRQSSIHFQVIPKNALSLLSASGLEDEKLLGHLLLVARNIAFQKGLPSGYHVMLDEDHRRGRLNSLHVFQRALHHMLWPVGPGSRL